jgi:hypothetical protein
VLTAFFDLCLCFYQNSTYCFLTTPSNVLPHILQLIVTVLDSCRDERAPLLAALHLSEALVGNTAATIDLLGEEKEDLHTRVRMALSEQGGGLIRQLLQNLTDRLPPALEGRVAKVFYGFMQRLPDLSLQWLHSGLNSHYVRSGIPHMSDDDCEAIFNASKELYEAGQNHRFAELWRTVAKIARREDTNDSIGAFRIVNTDIRGAKHVDAIFEGL